MRLGFRLGSDTEGYIFSERHDFPLIKFVLDGKRVTVEDKCPGCGSDVVKNYKCAYCGNELKYNKYLKRI